LLGEFSLLGVVDIFVILLLGVEAQVVSETCLVNTDVLLQILESCEPFRHQSVFGSKSPGLGFLLPTLLPLSGSHIKLKLLPKHFFLVLELVK